MKKSGRRSQLLEEINKTKESKNIHIDNESFVDFNTMELLPDVIDKDYGFVLMFGMPDNPINKSLSTNYNSVRSLPISL